MANITEEKWIEMLEKKADGTYIVKYPKVKSKSGVTFDEHLADNANPHNVTAAQIGAEPAFAKNTAFNKNFGTSEGTVAEGNHTHNQYALIAKGTYTGNGKISRNINVGFRPKFVIIFGESSDGEYTRGSAVAIDGAKFGFSFAYDYGTMKPADNEMVPLITSNGFTVGYTTAGYELNHNNSKYTWVAIS